MAIPKIDPRVSYRGVSELRKLNADTLRKVEGLIVVQDNGNPIAVIVPFDLYLEIQKQKGGDPYDRTS